MRWRRLLPGQGSIGSEGDAALRAGYVEAYISASVEQVDKGGPLHPSSVFVAELLLSSPKGF